MPDTIAVLAIRPARTDIGGYGGSLPRVMTALTGYTPSDGRDGFTLWAAIILGRLSARRG